MGRKRKTDSSRRVAAKAKARSARTAQPSEASSQATDLPLSGVFSKRFVILLCVIAVPSFLYYAYDIIRLLSYPLQWDFEDTLLYGAIAMIEKGNAYFDVHNGYKEIIFTPYNPLFLMLYGAILKLIGSPSLIVGRCITLVLAAGTALNVYLIGSKLANTRRAGIIAALLFLISPITQIWSLNVRTDFLAHYFTTLALLLYIRTERENLMRTLVIAFTMFLAYFSKQSAVVGAFALGCYMLFVKRRFVASVVYGASFAAFVVLSILVMNHLSDGNYFLIAFKYNKVPFFWHVFRVNWWRYLLRFGVVFVAATFLLAAGFASRNRRKLMDAHFLLVAIYFVLALAYSMLCGRDGFTVNHFFDLMLASVLVVGAVFALPVRKKMAPACRIVAVCLLISYVTCSVSFRSNKWMTRFLSAQWRFTPFGTGLTTKEKKDYGELSSLISDVKGELASSTRNDLILLNGKRMNMQPFNPMQMQVFGRWKSDNVVQAILDKKYEFGIEEADRTTDKIKRDYNYCTKDISAAFRAAYPVTKAYQIYGRTAYVRWPKPARSDPEGYQRQRLEEGVNYIKEALSVGVHPVQLYQQFISIGRTDLVQVMKANFKL